MVSTGSLNGAPIGSYAVNGGGIPVPLGGASTIEVDHTAIARIRRFAVASGSLDFHGRLLTDAAGHALVQAKVSGVLTARKFSNGAAGATFGTSLAALRRPVGAGIAALSFNALTTAVRRPFAAGIATVISAARGRIIRRPIARANLRVRSRVSVKLVRRPISKGRAITGFLPTGKAVRRPVATGKSIAVVPGRVFLLRRSIGSATISVSFIHLAQAGYLYFLPTDRRRIITVLERRHTPIAAEYRTVPVHRDNREIIIPKEAGN